MKPTHRNALRRIARRRRAHQVRELACVVFDPRTGAEAAAPFLVIDLHTGAQVEHDGPETWP